MRYLADLFGLVYLDHWIDVAKTSIVIYPIYGVRFDVLSKWFEKFINRYDIA